MIYGIKRKAKEVCFVEMAPFCIIVGFSDRSLVGVSPLRRETVSVVLVVTPLLTLAEVTPGILEALLPVIVEFKSDLWENVAETGNFVSD